MCGETKEHYDCIATCCKDCWKKRVAARRVAKLDEVRAYDRERSKLPHRRLARAILARRADQKKAKLAYSRLPENRAKRRAINQRLRKATDGYDKAHNYVARALAAGKIVRPPRCERCGVKTMAHAHHDDHAFPEKIMWLCPMCHTHRHQEIGKMNIAPHGVLPKDTEDAKRMLEELKKKFWEDKA
jgi:hypothetical protein